MFKLVIVLLFYYSSVSDLIDAEGTAAIASCIQIFMTRCGIDKVAELRESLASITDETMHAHANGAISIAENVFTWTSENAQAAMDAMCTSGRDGGISLFS